MTKKVSIDAINDIYYNPQEGLQSLEKLYKKLQERGIRITYKQLREYLQNQDLNQIFTRRKVKAYFPLSSSAPFQRLQIDLLDMSNQAIRGKRWIFVAVDVYTRYAFAIPMRNKTEGECLPAFKMIIDKIIAINGFPPIQLDSDNESAFTGRKFVKYCQDNNINQNISDINDYRQKGVVERFNRTLRGYIGKYKTAISSDWVEGLDQLLENYNNSYHSTLKKSPIDAIFNNAPYEKEAEEQYNEAKDKKYQTPLQMGDRVRIKIKRGVFDKEGNPWSKTTHTIVDYRDNAYYVSDRKLPYKVYELLKIGEGDVTTSRWSVSPQPPDVTTSRRLTEADLKLAEKEEKEFREQRLMQRRLNKESVKESNIKHNLRPRRNPDMGAVITTVYNRRKKRGQ
jgi:transposase InsO family protein